MSKTRKGINSERLKTIYARQDSPGWNSNYQPSILATPQEAPSISRAYILTPSKLDDRETHVLSTPERNAAFLGLYHPHVAGLQEQRMLSPEPSHHPLWAFPGIDKTNLSPLKGIIDVAERLELLDILPRLKIKNPKNIDEPITVIFPWIGDLLWVLKPSPDNVFCINWTIKDNYQDFKRPAQSRAGKTVSSKKARALLGRHEIEKIYYEDVKIRTVQIADEAIDHHVSANLRQLFLHHRRRLLLSTEQRGEILHKYQSALELGIPPTEVISYFAEKGRYTVDQCRSRFYQAIWDRELCVDLFQPILINRPMQHETRDVLEVYADWFRK
jgi:hypothetical protein